jgi:hypothetical protein
MSEIRRDPLRHWWVVPTVVVLMMVVTWVYAERPVVGLDGDARFLERPDAQLSARAADGDDAILRLEWRSTHDGDIRYSELDVRVNGAQARYVGRDPGIGEWSAQRDGVYLAASERARDGDALVIGGAADMSGARVQLVVDPCDCTAATALVR